ncbi:MAG: TetR/AcrR family transcriptional regulator [Actinobacteria bacterium]|nr:TetR/AcrR family transcriptional regulator [Actinomycetota bacterium]
MPRIEAATVAEHRAQVQARLVDAAEALLRERVPLTAGAVSTAAGIARNSIYRYVDSVEDLRALVVARYLPAWVAAVETAMDGAGTPADRVVTWVRSNLTVAAGSGHGWLMEATRSAPSSVPDDGLVDRAHTGMRDTLTDAWRDLLGDEPDQVAIAVALTMGVLEAGFRRLDAGSPVDLVVDLAGRAARGLVDGLT